MAFINWVGDKLLEAEFDAISIRGKAAARQSVIECSHLAEGMMKERAGEGGRHAKGTPTPASKGGGPAVVSGFLRQGIRVGDLEAFGAFGFAAKVGPTSAYGRRVELEYDFPYTQPGLEAALPHFPPIFGRNVAKAIAG